MQILSEMHEVWGSTLREIYPHIGDGVRQQHARGASGVPGRTGMWKDHSGAPYRASKCDVTLER